MELATTRSEATSIALSPKDEKGRAPSYSNAGIGIELQSPKSEIQTRKQTIESIRMFDILFCVLYFCVVAV